MPRISLRRKTCYQRANAGVHSPLNCPTLPDEVMAALTIHDVSRRSALSEMALLLTRVGAVLDQHILSLRPLNGCGRAPDDINRPAPGIGVVATAGSCIDMKSASRSGADARMPATTSVMTGECGADHSDTW